MVRFKKILCPVDFFPASELAAAYAAQLASLYSAQLMLLHVVSPVIPTPFDLPLDPSTIGTLEKDSEQRLKKLTSRLPLAGLKVGSDVRVGDVAYQIEKAVSTFKPNLIAMGTHGHRGFERWVLGSTTTRMIRRTAVPLLTISAPGKKRTIAPPLRRIMVTTDFSKDTKKALEHAFSIAQASQARLTLLHVLEEMRALTSAQYRAGLAKDAQEKLAKLVPAGVRNWCDVDVKVDAGTPYHMILMALKKEKIDLLVMNTHGKGMVERALVGSTTDRVVRAATTPVLLIPPG